MTDMNWASFEAVAKKRGLNATQRKQLKKRFDRWKRAIGPVTKQIRRSQMISEHDLTIRINVKDRD